MSAPKYQTCHPIPHRKRQNQGFGTIKTPSQAAQWVPHINHVTQYRPESGKNGSPGERQEPNHTKPFWQHAPQRPWNAFRAAAHPRPDPHLARGRRGRAARSQNPERTVDAIVPAALPEASSMGQQPPAAASSRTGGRGGKGPPLAPTPRSASRRPRRARARSRRQSHGAPR